MSELILYDFGNSVCCQKVRITLRAKGLVWRAIPVNLFTAEQYDAKYLKLNPKGVVPTLLHDGKPVIESTLICEYIDETFPYAPKLIPADPWLQSRMRLWSKFVDEGLFDGVTEISFSAMFRERMKAMPEESAKPVSAMSAIRAAPTVSSRLTSTVCSRRSWYTPLPPTSARSRCWSRRSPRAAVHGFSAPILRWPMSI